MGAKHKKTRKEKIIADYRHQVYSLKNKNITSLKTIAIPTTINSSSYSYVLRDVSKTLILTLTLIGFQLILFFLLKNHILSLPMVKY